MHHGFLSRLAAAVLTCGVLLSPAVVSPAAAQEALTPAQKEAVEKTVREYLLKNPEVIQEALQALQEKMRASAQEAVKKTIHARREQLFRDPASPVAGKTDGDVTVVEFFDYRCGYCKRVHPVVREILEKDRNVRFVYKEFPILSKESLIAARAALAARRQDKYEELHVALMEAKGNLDEAAIMQIAATVGLNLDRLRKDMAAPEIEAAIRANHELAGALGIQGTPAFIIGEALVPGAIDADTFRELIDEARKAGKKS